MNKSSTQKKVLPTLPFVAQLVEQPKRLLSTLKVDEVGVEAMADINLDQNRCMTLLAPIVVSLVKYLSDQLSTKLPVNPLDQSIVAIVTHR